MYLGLARGHFLNNTGGCKPFDASADGYCRAEGCVLFVLKRLSDAVAEGDRIHGVIRNVLVNQSGNSHSITHPHSETQTTLLNQMLKQKNIDPASVGVVEAHGTGTQAGDAREIETLKAVFGPHHSPANPLMVSSIKGNISHCEAASGAAGLAKLLLMLRKKEIPMQAGLATLNPSLGDLERFGLIIPRRTISWDHSKKTPRRAILNNFGAAGSNASLLLEDWVEVSKPSTVRNKRYAHKDRSAHVFTLTAKSEKALQSAVRRYVMFLSQEGQRPSLEDICYTATARRQHYDYRISFRCSTVSELMAKLERHQTFTAYTLARSVTATVFVFTGQGALYRGMGKELVNTCSQFRAVITRCDKIVQRLNLGCPSIIDFMLSEDQDATKDPYDTRQNIVTQCACVALEYALARTFMAWGVKPDYLIGHRYVIT